MLSPLFVQFNSRVGDLEGNRKRLQNLLVQAGEYPLALVPELALTGYPPRDLLEQEGLAQALRTQLETLAAALCDCGPVLLGALAPTSRSPGWLNAAYLVHEGQATMVAQKQLLPDYDVFDEPRYFAVGESSTPLDLAGYRVGVTVCEDLWGGQEVGEAARYDYRPGARLSEFSARVAPPRSKATRRAHFVKGKSRCRNGPFWAAVSANLAAFAGGKMALPHDLGPPRAVLSTFWRRWRIQFCALAGQKLCHATLAAQPALYHELPSLLGRRV